MQPKSDAGFIVSRLHYCVAAFVFFVSMAIAHKVGAIEKDGFPAVFVGSLMIALHVAAVGAIFHPRACPREKRQTPPKGQFIKGEGATVE